MDMGVVSMVRVFQAVGISKALVDDLILNFVPYLSGCGWRRLPA